MAKRKSAGESSDREQKWDNVFNALVKLSQNLHKDRNVLEDRIKYLLDVIYKLKLEEKVKSTGAEFLLGFKEREAFNYKHRYEDVEDELADFKELFDYLSHQCSKPKDISNDMSCKGQEQKNKALREEVSRVKTEFEKFKSEKISEISALLAEKNFLWNQYKNMESQLDTKFRKKCVEADHANEMVQVMVNRADALQLSNEKLRTDFSKTKSELSQKNQEISRLLKEIALLKSSSQSATPILNKCTAGLRATDMGAKTSNNNVREAATVKQESDHALAFEKKMTRTKPAAHKSTGGKAPRKQLNAKGSSSSKSNEVDIITILDSPKLFTSSFLVPKLKSSQSPQVV
ncbi:uncharacterized protein [Primulina eburnea]|uniref:uncharacterized protein isoform X1 n=2 Tax=Primulina eburnea TaxID=1245227 RepID=UPI003C6CBE9D